MFTSGEYLFSGSVGGEHRQGCEHIRTKQSVVLNFYLKDFAVFTQPNITFLWLMES